MIGSQKFKMPSRIGRVKSFVIRPRHSILKYCALGLSVCGRIQSLMHSSFWNLCLDQLLPVPFSCKAKGT